MPLSWSTTAAVAQALAAAYPEADRMALTPQELCGMVCGLEAFDGPPQPPSDRHLSAILWTWMRVADCPSPPPDAIQGAG